MKDRLFSELRTTYKSYFESKFATFLLAHPEFFSAVHKASRSICAMLIKYSSVVIHQLENNPALRNDLFSKKFFGHLSEEIATKKSDEQLKEIIRLLSDERTDLSYVMQFQSAFIYRIHPQIIKNMDPTEAKEVLARKERIKNIIGFEHKFDGPRRGRLPGISGMEKLSMDVGTVTNPVFYKILQKESKAYSFSGMFHEPAAGRFVPDEKSSYFGDIHDKDVSFVAGASSHANSFMQCATFCEFNKDELQEYAMACFAFLTSGGNHSFHEIMVVIKPLGIVYEINNYLLSIPLNIQRAPAFASLVTKFPEFLSDDISKKAIDIDAMITRMMTMADDIRTSKEPAILRLDKKGIASHMIGMATDMVRERKEVASDMMGMAVDLLAPENYIVPIRQRSQMISDMMGMTAGPAESKMLDEKIRTKMSALMATMQTDFSTPAVAEYAEASLPLVSVKKAPGLFARSTTLAPPDTTPSSTSPIETTAQSSSSLKPKGRCCCF